MPTKQVETLAGLKKKLYLCRRKRIYVSTILGLIMNFEILNFTIFCVNNVALRLNKSAKEVYHQMQKANIINGYIVPCYDVLHTFSKEYIVDDLVLFMQKKGALQ